MKIKVRVWEDRMGNVYARPISDRWVKKFAQKCKENGGSREDTCFFQEGNAAQEFLVDLTARQRKDVQSGWSVTILRDPWEVGHWYGYDAHTVCE